MLIVPPVDSTMGYIQYLGCVLLLFAVVVAVVANCGRLLGRLWVIDNGLSLFFPTTFNRLFLTTLNQVFPTTFNQVFPTTLNWLFSTTLNWLFSTTFITALFPLLFLSTNLFETFWKQAHGAAYYLSALIVFLLLYSCYCILLYPNPISSFQYAAAVSFTFH